MDLKNRLLSFRNTIDYELRNIFCLSHPIRSEKKITAWDLRVQLEFKEFLALFPWKTILSSFTKTEKLQIADVGARNFCFAPILDKYFEKEGWDVKLYGIEIDAYRRLANFHTRFDYGVFYASQCRSAEFHAMDFLKWNKPIHLALLLNPFVSEEPTVHWGLPLKFLNPKVFFLHAYSLLEQQSGIAILSSPSIEEFEIALNCATLAGFKIGSPEEEIIWRPHEKSQQKKPRYGIVLHSKLVSMPENSSGNKNEIS